METRVARLLALGGEFGVRGWMVVLDAASGAVAWRAGEGWRTGLLMWVPAGVIFIVFGVALFAVWLGEAEWRVRVGATGSAPGRLLLLGVAISLAACC